MNKIDSRIAFIGGIHGVGKSTICRQICSELKLKYLSAGKQIKWTDINDDTKNKKVKDIPDMQNRLILYLLDEHYCLLNSNSKYIPIEIFQRINPFSLNLILCNTDEVKNRLEARDNRYYDYSLLEHLQNEELIYAKYLSKELGISLNVGTQKNNLILS